MHTGKLYKTAPIAKQWLALLVFLWLYPQNLRSKRDLQAVTLESKIQIFARQRTQSGLKEDTSCADIAQRGLRFIFLIIQFNENYIG